MLMTKYYGCYGFKTETENHGFKEKPSRNGTAVFWKPCDGFT